MSTRYIMKCMLINKQEWQEKSGGYTKVLMFMDIASLPWEILSNEEQKVTSGLKFSNESLCSLKGQN